MKKPNITPGTWAACAPGEAADTSAYWEIEDGFGHTATVYGDDSEAESNARAIAAVPDLLESIEEMLSEAKEAGIDTMPGDTFAGFLISCENAREALIKAGYEF